MIYVALYLGCMFSCYFLASKLRSRSVKLNKPVHLISLISVSALVFLMGARMGSYEEIIANLGVIGIQSLLFTVVVMTGGILSVTLTRNILNIDKFGRLRQCGTVETVEDAQQKDALCCETSSRKETSSASAMTVLIIVFVILGLLFGYFYVRTQLRDPEKFHLAAGNIMTAGLCILMGSIGFDLGLAGTAGAQVRQIGIRVLVFPVAVIAGTAVSSALMSLLLPSLTLRECLAVGFGFGWYTFAPVTISGAGHAMAGAVSFMHNVIRETAGIILIPILAKKIGYIEVCSMPGVAAGDIGMSLVEKAARPDIMVYSFAIGMSESLLIPLLVTMSIGV